MGRTCRFAGRVRCDRFWRSFSVAPTTAFLRRPALHQKSAKRGSSHVPNWGTISARGFPPDRCRRPVFRQSDVNRVAQKERNATATRRFRQLPRRPPLPSTLSWSRRPRGRERRRWSRPSTSRASKIIERSLLANRRRSVRPIRKSSYRRRPAAQKTRQAASVASRYERENSAGARWADRRRLRAACPVPRPGRRP